jgi:hypothetical protein
MGQSVEQQWEEFWQAVAPKDASPIQQQEMRRAFYAGAWAMLMGCAGIGDDSVSEDAGVEQLEAWKQEMEAFLVLLQQGKV